VSKGLSRSEAGTTGDRDAYDKAMSDYGKNHRIAQIGGTVVGMFFDPTTYIAGGVGGLAGKGALYAGGRILAKDAAAGVGARLFGSTLGGRVAAGVAGGIGNLGTYEGMKEAENQWVHGGHVNAETGENEGYSAGEVLKSTGRGMLLGSVTGAVAPLLGNVADKAVKATSVTAGKVGIRAGEQAISTVAEGTVFATPEWIENSKLDDENPNKRSGWDIWTDSMATMLGFKAQHLVKSAPRVIAGLRPVANPKTMEERNHNRMSFVERLRKQMDGSPMSFTDEEREELKNCGYGDLAQLFVRTPKQQKQKSKPANTDGKTMYLDIPEADVEDMGKEWLKLHPEFDGYDAMERLVQDPNVSQNARAKAYYILTGHKLPMGTVTGCTRETDGKGNIYVKSVAANGEVVTRRRCKDEASAKAEEDNVMRQAELNGVDMGERYTEAKADSKVWQAAVEAVAPGADPETVMRNYKAVKDGDKDATANYGELVKAIDEFLEVNKGMADAERPAAIRTSIEEETGIDVDKALKKAPSKRTVDEQAVVEDYLKRLYPEQETESPMSDDEAGASAIYDQSRLLWDKVEQGDADAKADVDAIVLRMKEAYGLCEDAFGTDAEMRMAEMQENPWALVNDPELTEDQQDAVLYYINAKAAMDGVKDASNDAIENKRREVAANVERHTHKDFGLILPATMKVDNKKVYIVKGNVVPLPDGTGIDVRNSDQSIVICDAETGEYKFASPDQLFNMGEAIGPQTELDEAYADIQAEHESVLGSTDKGESVPNSGESVPETPENVQNEGENVQQPMTEEQLQQYNQLKLEQEQQRKEEEANRKPSALSRIPVNEKTQEPMFEKADKETALDALNEVTGGNEANTTAIVNAQVEQAQKALDGLKKKQPTKKAPTLKGSPMAMLKAQQEADANYNASMEQYNTQVAEAEETLNAWTRICSLMNERKRAVRDQQEVEPRERDKQLHDAGVAQVEEQKRIAAQSNLSETGDGKTGELDNNGRLEERKAKILAHMGDKYSLSEEHADNGESFIQNEVGSTNLAKIPDEIFDRIGISPVPFKLTETMGWHVFDHHGKEAKLNSISDAVDFVLSIINNVDHVRLGRDNSYIFSVENNRKRVGRRAVTIMINSKTGEIMGIRTSGYETLKNIQERPLLWERGADAAPEDVATPTITAIEPQQGDESTSRTKGQSNVSSNGKVINEQSTLQENGEKSSENEGVSPLSEQIATASADVNTEPTDAQKEAGNYKKGHVRVGTFDITIEQPEGSVRKGTDANGKQWESRMHNTYGYFKGTEGVDGDHIDVFLSTDIDGWNGRKVYVVDQYNPDGSFDEHKVMLGFNDMDEAKGDYLANYEKGWEDGRRIVVSTTNLEDFEKWIDSSHRKTKPFAEYAGVKKETDANAPAKEHETVEAKEEQPKHADIVSVGKGKFGDVYDQFKGDAQGAFAFLSSRKGGDLLGVFHRDGVGDIDVVWGDKGGGLDHIISKHVGNGKSFSSINEAAQVIEDIITTGKKEFENGDRIVFKKGSKLVTIRTNVREKGKKIADKNWVLTAYDELSADGGVSAIAPAIEVQTARHTDKSGRKVTTNPSKSKAEVMEVEMAEKEKKNASGGISDIDPEPKDGKQNGTAPLQDISSVDKVTEKASNKKAKEGNKVKPEQKEGDIFTGLFDKEENNELERNHDAVRTEVRGHKADGVKALSDRERVLRDAVLDHMRDAGLDVGMDVEEGQKVLDEANGDVRLEAKHHSESAEKRNRTLATVDKAVSFISGKPIKEVRAERKAREAKFKAETKELYDRILSGNFDDVTLQRLNYFLDHVTPNNEYGRRLSKRLPQEVVRRVRKGERTSEVDVLFSRICESSVPANERTRPEAKRRIEEKKKELLKAWAIATGNWHTSVEDFTHNTEPIGRGKDSVVYQSDDGKSVIKVSAGKDNLKKFRPDIDAVTLFNHIFRNNPYKILGYGEVDGKFVKFLKQPFVDFADSTPLSAEERVRYMEGMGFKPMNEECTAFSNGKFVVADLQGNNIVKDKSGNIRVIDADVKLHTKDFGGSYEYPAVEADIPVDKVRYFRTANGEAYGFTVGGRMCIDPRIAGSDTPIHEYAHLWASALRACNPEEWKNVVALMKGTPIWDEVKERYPDLKTDDEIADEVLAHYSGRRGAERLREEARKIADGNGGVFEKAEAISALDRVKRALDAFWKGVCDFLHIHYTSAEEVADRVMKDLLDGVDPRKMGKSEKSEVEEFAERHGVNEEYVDAYAKFMKMGDVRSAHYIMAEIRRTLRMANRGLKLSEFKEVMKPIQAELYERFGDLDALQEAYEKEAAERHNIMEAARKKAEEEEAARRKHMEELAMLADADIDKRYMDALEKGDEATAREMLDEAGKESLSPNYAMSPHENAEMNEKAKRGMPMTPEAKRAEAERLAEKFNTRLNIIEDTNAIVHNDPKAQARRRKAKGWYDTRTGEVTVVLPNNMNVTDIENTFVHEVVGHDGLRVLFPEEETFNNAMDELYRVSADGIKQTIDRKAKKMYDAEVDRLREKKRKEHEAKGEDSNASYYADMAEAHIEASKKKEKFRRDATEEYGADLAGRIGERGFEKMSADELTFWGKLKAMLQKALQKLLAGLKIPGRRKWSDKDWAFVLHEAYKRKKNGGNPTVFDAADTEVMRRKTGFGELKFSDGKRGQKPSAITTIADMKQRVTELFEKAKTGEFVGKPASIGRLSADGKAYLEKLSGLNFKEFVDFVLNPSDLNHIRSDHYGENEKDKGNNVPLTDEDIQNMVDVLNQPDGILYGVDKKDGRKLFFFLKDAGNGLYNLTEVCSTKKGNLTAKSFFKSKKKGISQRVMEIKDSLLPTSVTYSGEFLSSDAKIPTLFDINESPSGNVADEGIMFRDGEMGLDEVVTQIKIAARQANADNWQAKENAMRAIGGNLTRLRQAMARQRDYDRSTVKGITDLAKVLLNTGLLDDLSKYETKRILSSVNSALGKHDISSEVTKVMDIMVDNQLRMGAKMLGRLLSVRGSRVDARGIEFQGKLDPNGRAIAQVARKAMSLPKADIEECIADALDRMGSDVQAIADNASLEYSGLLLAHQYAEDVTESKAEERALRESHKQAKEDLDAGNMEKTAYDEYVSAANDAIRQNKIERAEAYRSIVEQLGVVLGESVERAKKWREAEIERVEAIHHNANSDMEGRPTDEHHKEDKLQKMVNNSAARFLLAPLATFDQMLRMFGKKSVNGEGYLWNRYMRGWLDATEREYTGYQNALKRLDEKVSEVFGKDMKWGALFGLERKMPKVTVTFWDGGEMKAHELTQGNLLYIYMVDKMSDGRMKLRKMGITGKDVEEIKEFIDPRFLELADWMQEEFLVEKRNEYNEVHKRMFGASMASIENYFPLKILANARMEEVDVADDTAETALPATSTGGIIKRRRNNLALDVMGADAFGVICSHLQEMERWAAFAEFNRDLNTLLSYKRFRNQVMNMTSAYGAGKTLWDNFRNVCSMAAGVYRPPVASLDKAATNFAKGVSAAKVSFRVFTALKQFLSMPAYLSDSNPVYLAADIANPVGAWKWSMENLPLFEKRWKSRMAGDPRLMKSEMDWKMWRNHVVEIASRIGMSPNAFVDALTVSIGAHSMYKTKLAKYLRYGYDRETAGKRAKQDATILFNQTQQSSESAFLSTMQVDRSWLSVLFTIFRNSSMAYTRMLYNSLRNMKHRLFEPGYKERSVEFMAKQMRRDGIEADKARRNAESEYRRSWLHDIATVGVFGYILQFAWNLGAYVPYFIMGDDKDEKDSMWDDVINHTMFGSVEGLTGGDVMSSFGNMLVSGEGELSYLTKDMPLASDLATILQKMPQDKVSAMNDVVNLLVQSGVGANPQSLTDAVVAIMDYCNGDAASLRECALLIARVLNCPQSQMDKVYFDELGATASEASKLTPEEIAERYAEYKIHRGAPLTGWAYTEEVRGSLKSSLEKRVLGKAEEKVGEGVGTSETKRLLSACDDVSKQQSKLSKLKGADNAAYRAGMKRLRENNDMRQYYRVKRYKHDMKQLTEKYLRSKDAAERDSIVKVMFSTRDKMLDDVGKLKR
jgi:hypothetical protein